MAARYPEVFWFFLLVIPFAVLFLWNYRTGKNAVTKLGGIWQKNRLIDVFVVKWFFSFLGLGIFIVFIILSMAGFPGKTKREPYAAEGWDTVFVMDISRSMYARDALPSRLDRAKNLIMGITDSLDTGRFGLVVFRGGGSQLFPLSEDKVGLINFLSFITPDVMTSPGTNIAAGLEAAFDSFVTGMETNRRIILLSDGGELSGDVNLVLNNFRDRGITLIVIGVGTAEGTSIPLPDGTTIKDAAGRDVISRLNERSLQRLAEMAGGKYYPADDQRLLSHIMNDYHILSPAEGGGFIEVETEGFRIYVILALCGLVLYLGARLGRWKETI